MPHSDVKKPKIRASREEEEVEKEEEEEEEEGVEVWVMEGGSARGGSAYTARLISSFIDFKEHHQVAQSRDNRAQSCCFFFWRRNLQAEMWSVSYVAYGRSSASWEQEAK